MRFNEDLDIPRNPLRKWLAAAVLAAALALQVVRDIKCEGEFYGYEAVVGENGLSSSDFHFTSGK